MPVFDPDAERHKRVRGVPNSGEVRLGELYQEVILDHNRRPRNYGKLEDATCSAHGVNPLCGDDYFVYLKLDKAGVIRGVGFEGQGCAISKSSASMMTLAVEGKTAAQAGEVKDAFLKVLTAESVDPADRERAGKLKIFEGVKQYPIRVKCAALAWRALEEALKEDSSRQDKVTTEE